jgi:polar amino acid transport system substrate-binding protein
MPFFTFFATTISATVCIQRAEKVAFPQKMDQDMMYPTFLSPKATSLLGSIIFVTLLGGTTSASADLLSDIQAKGVFTVGTEARFPPFEFVENGEIVGYSSDIMELIMAHPDMEGVTLDQLDLPWQGILPGLQASRFDYVVTSVTATAERYEAYHLSVPIADATMALLKKAGNDAIMTPEDIAGKRVGSQTGSAQLQALQNLAAELSAAGSPVGNIRDYVDFNEAYADLAAGRLDAVVNSLPNLLEAARERPDMFEVVADTFGPPTYFAWAARKDENSATLAAFMDERLVELNESGDLGRLQEKWFGRDMQLPTQMPNPAE